MADFLDAATWIATKLATHWAETMTCLSGDDSCTVTGATIGGQLLRVTDQRGVARTIRTELDVIFPTDSLDFGDGVVEPPDGMRVRLTTRGTLGEYDMVPPGANERAWRYTSGYREAIRCHLKYRGPVT